MMNDFGQAKASCGTERKPAETRSTRGKSRTCGCRLDERDKGHCPRGSVVFVIRP